MSGGGFGGYYHLLKSRKPDPEETEETKRDIKINKLLEEILKDFNSRDVAAINTHLEQIVKALGKEIEGTIDVLYGGSISKRTFIEGLSDVDALVFLDPSKYNGESPKQLQDVFFKLLQSRFPKTTITKGELAVTVKFSDYEIQLLPALKNGDRVQIPDRGHNEWSVPINVKAFSNRLTDINKNNSNKVVPVIKLAKSILSNLPDQYKMSGYHIEALAVDAFRNYSGRYTLFEMTKHFLESAQKRVLSPCVDVTGQSGTIDDYLGKDGSRERAALSSQIKIITDRFSSKDESELKTLLSR